MNSSKISTHENTASVLIMSGVFYGMAALLAEFTVLTHLAQMVNLTFQLYAAIALGICLVTVVGWFLFFKHWTAQISKYDTKALLVLVGLGIIGSIIALIVNRPDDDDFYYVPNAIFYLQNPKAVMGFNIHYLFSNHEPFASFSWATANAYEYMQAIVAFGFHLRFLDVYYFIMPALAGFFIPMALYLAIVHFSDDTFSAVIGTFVTIGVILSLGETHRTFGNFFFCTDLSGQGDSAFTGYPPICCIFHELLCQAHLQNGARLIVLGHWAYRALFLSHFYAASARLCTRARRCDFYTALSIDKACRVFRLPCVCRSSGIICFSLLETRS